MPPTTISGTITLPDSVKLFKAAGDETRIKMLALLLRGELCVCDLMEVLDLAQSTASRHLAYLRNSGWITGRRQGKWMYYRLTPGLKSDQFTSRILQHLQDLPEMQSFYGILAQHLLEKAQSDRCGFVRDQ